MADRNYGMLLEFNPSIHEWDIYKARIEQYFIANKIEETLRKRAIILNSLSQEAFKLLSNLCVPEVPQNVSYDNIIKHLDSYYVSTKAVFVERYKFYSASKKSSESLQE
ncbi:hypothetical protein PPYR_08385 [Photinus pyralis]|uniref:Uncharacterized protein n=1 Tax=Photinus pyralis TaxID=7054 RepID=A0A5N4AJ96_PHOPY|nr:hypothetical protein PPYR_08385 [Photinus pyralis]